MCGIAGYIGKKEAVPILMEALKRLEYRGYDSAGLAVLCYDNNKGRDKVGTSRDLPLLVTGDLNNFDISNCYQVKCIKAKGRIAELEKKLEKNNLRGTMGIAHTRWATHGVPSEKNAHPHYDCKANIFVVHNGIVENYKLLKKQLEKEGHKFYSETDTEVISHLIEKYFVDSLEKAVARTLGDLRGAFGMAIISSRDPYKIVVARESSPLVIGIGKDEFFVASDPSAIIIYTNKVIYLADEEMATLTLDNYQISTFKSQPAIKSISVCEWRAEQIEKGKHSHFMLKEIFEGPEAIQNSIRGRIISDQGLVKLGGLEVLDQNKLRSINRIILIGCGTASFACLVGEYMLEEYAGIPVEVELGSEFRYRKPIIDSGTAIIAVSQSGETADTLASLREARRKGALVLGIVNVVGSTIARETEAGVYNHVGPEIGVASTKAFISQLVVLALITVYLGRMRGMSMVMGKRITSEILRLPSLTERVLKNNERIKNLANKYSKYKNFLFMGRKYNYPIAEEGAHKLKEIAYYIHAEGYPSGEPKHGAIAMIDENFPSIFIVPNDSVYEKNRSNMEEIKSRKGKIIAITTEGNEDIKDIADDVIYIPKTLEMLTPILTVIPLQLFTAYMGIELGCDIDKPRNLAKSVTVE